MGLPCLGITTATFYKLCCFPVTESTVPKHRDDLQIVLLDYIACTDSKDAAYCYRCSVVCMSVCWSQAWAKLTEMTFWLWTQVGQRNHVLGGGLDPSGEGAIMGLFPHWNASVWTSSKRRSSMGLQTCPQEECITAKMCLQNGLTTMGVTSSGWCGLSSIFFDYLL